MFYFPYTFCAGLCLCRPICRPMFADDTNISSIGNSPADIEVKLNNDLYNVNNWLIANKLTLNVKKLNLC